MIPQQFMVLLQDGSRADPTRDHEDSSATRLQTSSKEAQSAVLGNPLGQVAAPDSQRLPASTPHHSTASQALESVVLSTDDSLKPRPASAVSHGSDGFTALEVARPEPISGSHSQPRPAHRVPAHPQSFGPQCSSSDRPGSEEVGVLSSTLQPREIHASLASQLHIPAEDSIPLHHDTSPAVPRRLASESYSPPRHSSPLSNDGISCMPPTPSNQAWCRCAMRRSRPQQVLSTTLPPPHLSTPSIDPALP